MVPGFVASNGIGIGNSADGNGNGAIGIGFNGSAIADSAIAIGAASSAKKAGSIALGDSSFSDGNVSMALGVGANTGLFNESTAIGYLATATKFQQIRLGRFVDEVRVPGQLRMDPMVAAGDDNLLVISTRAGAPADNGQPDGSMMLDTSINRIWFRSGGVWTTGVATGNTLNAVLSNGNISGAFDIIFTDGYGIRYQGSAQIGTNNTLPASVLTTTGIAFGRGTQIEFNDPIAIGTNAIAKAENAIAVGTGSTCQFGNSGAIGQGATATRPNQLMLGGNLQDLTCPNFVEAGKVSHILVSRFNQNIPADALPHAVTFDNLESYGWIDNGVETPYITLPLQPSTDKYALMNDRLYHFEFGATYEVPGLGLIQDRTPTLDFILIRDSTLPASGTNISVIFFRACVATAGDNFISFNGSMHYRVPAAISAPNPAFQVRVQTGLLWEELIANAANPSRLFIHRLDAIQ